MPHPKRRFSKHRKRIRRSHLRLNTPQVQEHPRTGVARLPHKLNEDDTHYGFKKGGDGGFEVREHEEL